MGWSLLQLRHDACGRAALRGQQALTRRGVRMRHLGATSRRRGRTRSVVEPVPRAM
jgi:hypothetical protein